MGFNLLKNVKVIFFLNWQIVLFIMLIAKVVFVGLSEQTPKIFEDHDIAINLYKTGEMFYLNDGVINHSFQFPFYPFLLFVLYSFFGLNLKVAIIFNVLLSSASAIFIYKFSILYFKRKMNKHFKKIAVYSSLASMIYPFTNIYAFESIHPFSMNLFLLVFFLYVSELWIQQKIKLYWLALVFSVLLVQRSSLFFISLFFLWETKALWRIYLRKNILILLLSLILPLLWMSRNYYWDKMFSMTSTTGKILWKGGLVQSDGSNYIEGDSNYTLFFTEEMKKNMCFLSVKQQNNLFKNEAIKNLFEHPKKSFIHYFVKLKGFFFFRKNIGQEYPNYLTYLFLYKVFYIVILFSSIFFVARNPKYLGIVIPFLFLGLFHSVFYVETRHRIIYEPIFIMLSIAAFVEIKYFIKKLITL